MRRRLRGFDREIPFVNDDDDGAAGLLGVAGNGGVALSDALFAVNDENGHIGAFESAAGHDHA